MTDMTKPTQAQIKWACKIAQEALDNQVMKPTPVQIEAAATAIQTYLFEVGIDAMALAKAALTAAAEVKAPMFDQRTPDGPFELASGEAMPTAAAEVGEQDGLYLRTITMAVEQATIERCAQVAERFENGPLRYEIAAAIRARKDEK